MKGDFYVANVFDYLLWRGDLHFTQSPVNEIDSLIFSRLAYLPFEKEIGSEFTLQQTISQVVEPLLLSLDPTTKERLEEDIQLLEEMPKHPRFAELRLGGFLEIVDIEQEEQFAAVVFELTDDIIFVAFRGTDNTLVGWKENFNMSYIAPVPAQKDSVHYLEQVAKVFPHSQIVVGGHSKGGNLAVYSSVFCRPEVQQRITAVYNNDGPGFNSEVIAKAEFAAVQDRIQTYVPQSSVVGMLMERKEPYIIVKSEGISLSQHNLYLWEVVRNHFVEVERVTDSSKFFDQTLKTWVRDMDQKQLGDFVEALFYMISAGNVTTTTEITQNWYENIKAMLKVLTDSSNPTSEALSVAVRQLLRAAQQSLTSPQKVVRDDLQELPEKSSEETMKQ